MSKFPSTPLAELKAPSRYSMVGGPFGSKLVSRDYVESGVPVIRGGNLPFGSRFSFEDMVYVTEEKVEADLAGNLAFPGDIVVTQRGTLGQIGLIPEDSPHPKFVVSQSQMKLTVDRSKADPLFVYYVLKSPIGQHEIHSRAITAGVPHINLSLFQKLQMPMPPLPIQHKIAAVLSAYDDLIENNSRRIKLLEEMAQRIYREWFVDFRYPGHESVALVDSEFGPIPSGWTSIRVSDRFEVVLGGTPARKNAGYWSNGSIPWINSSQVNKLRVIEGSELITPEALAKSSTKLMPPGTTLLAITGATLGQVSLLEIEACGNQSVVGIYDKQNELSGYLYLAICNSIGSIIGAASGGAQQHINQQNVRDAHITLPSSELGEKFQMIVEPLLSMSTNLLRANSILRNSCNLLLPRLISGEIDVIDLNIALDETAA